MLKNTLILPRDDDQLAAYLLGHAINDLTVVLMLVIDPQRKAQQIVEWADLLCEKTRTGSGNMRRVVWIMDPATPKIREILAHILGAGNQPFVAVLNFYDQVKAGLGYNDHIDPIVLEKAFLAGHRL